MWKVYIEIVCVFTLYSECTTRRAAEIEAASHFPRNVKVLSPSGSVHILTGHKVYA